MFPSARGNINRHENIIRRALIPVQIAAGVTGKRGADGRAKAKYTGLHALRHFYASGASTGARTAGLNCRPKSFRSASATRRS